MKNTITNVDAARAILSKPRSYYANLKNNAEDAEELTLWADMLVLWDEYASEFPEIVEATEYFTAAVRPNCMAIRFVQASEFNGATVMWVDLKTAHETRQCCYELDAEGCWNYFDGDREPEMSKELANAWEKANDILTRVYNTEQTNFVSAN